MLESIKKLRKHMASYDYDPDAELYLGNVLDYLKAIEQEIAEGYVKLPVDADGVPIRVGDVMERGKAHGRVIALMLSNYPKKWGGALHWGIQLEGEHAPTALDLTFHHYHEPTVEDVLREFADAMSETHPMDVPARITEYAAKLQLRED